MVALLLVESSGRYTARLPYRMPVSGLIKGHRGPPEPSPQGRVSPQLKQEETIMKYVYALATVAALSTPAFAAQTMSSLPPDSFTVTDYYKQDVYDHSKNTVGKIDDVLIDKSGKITALIVGVGGFLGMGEWDVALPFTAVKAEKKDNKWYLTVDETKDSLKSAVGYKYDSSTTTWSPVSK
jgi:sporulation protein YlmC with PRC-barrel domain